MGYLIAAWPMKGPLPLATWNPDRRFRNLPYCYAAMA